MKKRLFKGVTIFILFFFCFPFFVQASNIYNAYFSSIYPNTFNDYDDEYFEISNVWSQGVDLSWFYIKDKSGKTYTFPGGSILAGSWILKLPYAITRIQLNNSDEELYFYDPAWNLIDNYSYKTSIKWELINRDLSSFVPISNSWSSTETWETNSGETNDSNSWSTGTGGSIDFGSWETSSGSTQSGSETVIKSFFTNTWTLEIWYTW